MDLQKAKEILEDYVSFRWGTGVERPDSRNAKQALDIAIQCLEDSIQNNEDATFDNH